jgi:hypothetical protein
MASPLSRQALARVYKELDEVAVAVSVVGTRRQKLMDLARMAYPARDALVGSRPEVKKLRDDLTRAIHNVRRSQTRPARASKAIWKLAAQIKRVQKLVAKGLGDVPSSMSAGGLEVSNVWGYSEREAKPLLGRLDKALGRAKDLGLGSQVVYGEVILDPGKAGGRAVSYDPHKDQLVGDPSKGSNRDLDIAEALAARVWLASFGPEEHAEWGGSPSDFDGFVRLFSDMLAGKKLDRGLATIMAATTGVEHGRISEAIIPKEPPPKGSVKLSPLAIEKAIESIKDGRGRILHGHYVKVGNMSHASGPGFVTVKATGDKGPGVTFYSIGPKTAARRAARFVYNAAKKKGKEEAA